MRRLLSTLAATVLVTAGLTGTASAAPAAPPSGTLNLLSYNVAGLPELISSASTPRESSTTAIGQRLGPYDIVQVQEDFNYHAYLYATDTHPYRTPTSGGAAIGSGLNTLSSLPYDEDDFERARWDSCQFDSGDCLTPKGFTFMRERLAEGVYVDFYNLHANAGTNAGDLESRADNLNQLSRFIASHSTDNAVVVMGDTNTRYTRAKDTIAAFGAANGLTDAWVEVQRGGVAPAPGTDALVCDEAAVTNDCEVVDKVLYRGNNLVHLDATSYNNEHAKMLDAAGAMLSDHDPIAVQLAWSADPGYRLSDQFGGPHGDYFTDLPAVPAGARVSTVTVRAGSRVDGFALTLATGTTLTHGGTGGTARTLTLGADEYVTTAQLCQGKYSGHTRIFSATFTTNLGRMVSGGSATGDCVTRTAPAGWQLAGFHGRAGGEIDKIGFIFTAR